jgi:hypothetical protein
MRRPAYFLAMASRTAIVSATLPRASRTIDQSRLAISHARLPALTDGRIIARSRAGKEVPSHSVALVVKSVRPTLAPCGSSPRAPAPPSIGTRHRRMR